MENVLCLNLCELLSYFVNEEISREEIQRLITDSIPGKSFTRIYFGSSFCSQYFLQLEMDEVKLLMEVCRELHLKTTMVLPVFSEKDLQAGKQKITLFQSYFGECIDEVTVNDYGMLEYVSTNYNIKINLGRLFIKDYRDPRYEEYSNQKRMPNIFNSFIQQLLTKYEVHGMEFDGTHKVMDLTAVFPNIELGIHSPFCYLTKGHICGYASLSKGRYQKFRPNSACKRECQQHLIQYEVGKSKWIRFGRTIYFPSETEEVLANSRVRIIFFPLEKVVYQ